MTERVKLAWELEQEARAITTPRTGSQCPAWWAPVLPHLLSIIGEMRFMPPAGRAEGATVLKVNGRDDR